MSRSGWALATAVLAAAGMTAGAALAAGGKPQVKFTAADQAAARAAVIPGFPDSIESQQIPRPPKIVPAISLPISKSSVNHEFGKQRRMVRQHAEIAGGLANLFSPSTRS